MDKQPGFMWASDVPISLPEANTDVVYNDMGAHAITENGLVHNLSPADLEELRSPTFAPDLSGLNG